MDTDTTICVTEALDSLVYSFDDILKNGWMCVRSSDIEDLAISFAVSLK